MEEVKDTANEGKGKKERMEIIAVFPPPTHTHTICLQYKITCA